jgi:hypothetical protein
MRLGVCGPPNHFFTQMQLCGSVVGVLRGPPVRASELKIDLREFLRLVA